MRKRQLTSFSRRSLVGAVLAAALIVLVASSGVTAHAGGTRAKADTITVWPDATRLPAFKLYQKTHPNVPLKIVTWDGDANGPTPLQTKVSLFNRSGHGWPDVVFSGNPGDVAWIAAPPYNFAAPLNGLVPESTIKGYPGTVNSICNIGGKVYCLRNDLAQVVLWYNAPLMKKFGYQVPKTWEEYEQLGLKVAKDHPGYVIGALGTVPTETYFSASRCPMHTLLSPTKVLINIESPLCQRVVTMLDTLLKAKAVTPLSELGPDFAKKYGTPNKVLMMVGASWYGEYIFHQGYHSPAKTIAAARPLKWASEPRAWTGEVGGGIYMLSRHTKDQKAAADVLNWVATSPVYQATAPTYPAYGPAAVKWLAKRAKDHYFFGSVAPAFTTAAREIWAGYGYPKFFDQSIWVSVVVPVISSGGTVASAWKKFGDQSVQQAKINGYQVVTK